MTPTPAQEASNDARSRGEKLPSRRSRFIVVSSLIAAAGASSLAAPAVSAAHTTSSPVVHAAPLAVSRSLWPTTWGTLLPPPTITVGTALKVSGIDVEYASAPTYSGPSALTSPTSLGTELMQRSEVYWGDANGRLILRRGDTVTFEANYRVNLAGTDSDPNQWAVVWQILGPTDGGTWPAPPITLHISKGSWRIGGGAGYPGGSREAYAPNFPPFVNDALVHWKIRVRLAADQATARVDAWLDGRAVVTDWHPPGGTMYANQSWLTAKSGLYIGGANTLLRPATRTFAMDSGSFALTR